MKPTQENNNEWSDWRRVVLKSLEDQASDIDKVQDTLVGVKVALAELQTKATIWGAVAGFIPGVIIAIITLVTK